MLGMKKRRTARDSRTGAYGFQILAGIAGLSLLAAGCTINLTEGHAGRVVSHLAKQAENPRPFVGEFEMTPTEGKGVRYQLAQYGPDRMEVTFASASTDRAPGASVRKVRWDDEVFLSDPSQGLVERFHPLPRLSRAERRQQIEIQTRSMLRNNSVVLTTGQRIGQWKTNQTRITPKASGPFALHTDGYFEGKTMAIAQMRLRHDSGLIDQTLRLRSLDQHPGQPTPPTAPTAATVRDFRVPAGDAPRVAEPANSLAELSRPRYGKTGEIEAWDFTRGGVIHILYRRPAGGPSFVSPLNFVSEWKGARINWFLMNSDMALLRWEAGGQEYTLLTTLPGDLAERFLTETRPWWSASPSSADGAGPSQEGAASTPASTPEASPESTPAR